MDSPNNVLSFVGDDYEKIDVRTNPAIIEKKKYDNQKTKYSFRNFKPKYG
ncbi:protein of unknown function [Petrocella atlantisensis]|uniref:Uncharacterized protein n=1 Tax=Petrocella atlantisensis TaxID=2173034 RepID=A0A3P7NWL5_9FIRM|nr:protein of unknown function [Petrocella atlantisensis]